MFLAQQFTSSFLTKDWKQHRADVLFERERSLFPDAMEHIQRDKEVDRLRKRITGLQQQRDAITREIYNLQEQVWGIHHPTTSSEPKKVNMYMRPCSASECRGYINEKNGECGVCNKKTCVACNVTISESEEEQHECKEEDIHNWDHIHKNTKPCPNCHVRIHKISGCYQMWCPQCHTAFNYNTGQIEKGAIHNPHYYDYLRRNPNAGIRVEDGNRRCDRNRLPDTYMMSRVKSPRKEEWLKFHRLLTHIRHVELPKYHVTPQQEDRGALQLRKEFLLNIIGESHFKRRIQEREKRERKKHEVRTILEMFLTVGGEMLFGYIRNARESLYEEMTNLIAYTNDSIQLVNKNYQCKIKIISSE